MSGILLASVGASYSAAPVNTVAPAVTGTASFGSTLTTTNGTWTGAPAPTFSYQWQRVTTNISGATSSTYVLVAADVGSTIRCVVTATNIIAAVSANSNSTATVAAVVPGAPTIGTATQTGATTATVTYTAPASDGGATITLYTATSSPAGGSGTLATSGSGTITVSGLTTGTSYTFTVTATNSAGTSAPSAASNSVTPVEPYWIGVFGTIGYSQTLQGVAVNSSGALYIAGEANVAGTSGTAPTLKFNSAGTIQYQKGYYNTSTLAPAYFNAITVGSDGSVYTTGYLTQGPTSVDIGVVKFDSAGNITWQRALADLGSEQGYAVAVDSSDNVYSAGSSNSLTSYNRMILGKWNSSGTLQYQRDFTTGGSTYHFAYGVAVNGDNVYIAGQGGGFGTPAVEAVLINYNQSGNSITWQKRLGSSNTDYFQCVTIDSSQNVYVAGEALDQAVSMVAKYDSSGTLQWQRKLGGAGGTSYYAIALDSSNNVYALGDTSDSGTAVLQIAKYNSSGTIQWQRKITQSTTIFGRSIAILGNVMYIGGTTHATAGGKYLFVKLPTDGSLTGTYSVGGFSYTYAASTLTDADAALTEGTPAYSVATSTLTGQSQTYSNPTSSQPSSVTQI